jgi:cell division protein FtsA
MASKYVSVLDFGSSKVSVMIGEKGINGTFNIRGQSDVEYAGYFNGEFVEPEKLYEVVSSAIIKAETNSGLKVTKLYVGVPAEFSFVENRNGSVAFGKRCKIKSKHILQLFDNASREIKYKDATIISRSPVYFVLDDNRKIVTPEGEVSTKISGQVSFVLADNKFVNIVDNLIKNMGLPEIEYVSSPLAESLYILDPETRDSGAILIDVGYLTTFVAHVKGDGILSLNKFSVGGGHISADLCQVLQIPFIEAENLKRKVVLSLEATDADYYEVNINGNVTPVSAKLTGEIVSARLDMIIELAVRSLTQMRANSYVPLYLTGGGVCLLKGGKDYIAKRLGENIEIISSKVPGLSKPNYSSILGLLDLALKAKQNEKKSFWQRLFKK